MIGFAGLSLFATYNIAFLCDTGALQYHSAMYNNAVEQAHRNKMRQHFRENLSNIGSKKS
jgi:hypothetical protein